MEFGGAEVGRSTPARLRFGLRSRPPKFYRITDRLLKFVAIGSLVLALTEIATVLVLSVGVSDPPSQTSIVRKLVVPIFDGKPPCGVLLIDASHNPPDVHFLSTALMQRLEVIAD